MGANDFIEQRVQGFAKLAIEAAQSDEVEIAVHPNCVTFLNEFLGSEPGVTIAASAEVEPGDCQVFYGQLVSMQSLKICCKPFD